VFSVVLFKSIKSKDMRIFSAHFMTLLYFSRLVYPSHSRPLHCNSYK